MKAMPFCICAILVGAALSTNAGEPSATPQFTKAPTAKKVGGKTRIEFAVNAETDVAVYILDAKDKVICHLVAGVLGAKAPAPFRPGLSQSIDWDGKGDDGKPAVGGPFKVRVAVGLKPEFDRFLLYNPDYLPRIQSLACGSKGGVYVLYLDAVYNPNQGGLRIKALDREGKHQRMLLPFPADVPYEKVKPMGAFQDEQKRLVPQIYSWQTMKLRPDPLAPRRAHSLIGSAAVDSKGTVHLMLSGGRLASLDADGGSPYATFMSEKLFPKFKFACGRPVLCVGDGNRYLYVSGIVQADNAWRKNSRKVPCVYRVDLRTRAPATPFVGKPDTAGAKDRLLTEPLGIACAKGLLYVVDAGRDRVLAFKESDGSPAGEVKVKAPRFIGVDPRSGALYVVCRTKNVVEPELVKFDGIKTGKEVCRVKMPRDSHTKEVRHRIAVDCSDGPTRIWSPVLAYTRNRICRIDDAGDKLVVHDDILEKAGPAYAGGRDLVMDRRRGELYVDSMRTKCRIDEATCKVARIGLKTRAMSWGAGQLVPCSDGTMVSMGNERGLMRWTHDGKPLPWDGRPDNSPKWTGITGVVMTLGPVGSLAVHDREMYVVVPRKALFTPLNVLGMDGKVKRTAIWQCTARAIPRVDRHGNIYLAEAIRPKGRTAPKFFDGKRDFTKRGDPYNYCYGSIVKFPPTGGAVWYVKNYKPVDRKTKQPIPDPTVGRPPANLLAKPEIAMSYTGNYVRGLRNGTVQGAQWVRFGFSPYSSRWGGGKNTCHCENAGFDVDDFGRVFYPNLGQFRVEMVDTDNNWIGSFGHYGNQDSGGADAKVKTPEIPLAWPTYVAVSDKYAYVSDTVNQRIVRVKLGYAAEASCAVQ